MIFLKKVSIIIVLEHKRQTVLPKMATCIQTIWRKCNAKKRVKMIRAVYTIMAWYKKYKLRSYFNVIFKVVVYIFYVPLLYTSLIHKQ